MNTQLKGDPLSWLLEPDQENPGVRYFALRDLLHGPEDDLGRSRAEVMRTGPVPAILEAQHPEGYWARPGGGHSPSYRVTVWQIIFLAELGADPDDERVQRGCNYLLNHSTAANGGLAMSQKPVPSSVVHCMNGDPLAALLHLKMGDDPRVQAALTWQVQAILGEEPIKFYKSGTSGPNFACGYNGKQPCAWGATKALKALSAVPADQRTPMIAEAIEIGVEFLLGHDLATADYPYTDRVSSGWFKFGFPLSYRSDVLETAFILSGLGYRDDPRLKNALRLILSKQDDRGRWIMERSLNGKMWADIEKKGKPSKWVTLRAVQIFSDKAISSNTAPA